MSYELTQAMLTARCHAGGEDWGGRVGEGEFWSASSRAQERREERRRRRRTNDAAVEVIGAQRRPIVNKPGFRRLYTWAETLPAHLESTPRLGNTLAIMFLPRGGARRCWLAAGSPVRPYLRGWHQRCIPTECKTGDHTVCC